LDHFLMEVGNDFVPARMQGYTHRLRQQTRSFGRSPELAPTGAAHEDAQAFCEKNALDVELALRGGAGLPKTP
jgi:hypothetical protein